VFPAGFVEFHLELLLLCCMFAVYCLSKFMMLMTLNSIGRQLLFIVVTVSVYASDWPSVALICIVSVHIYKYA